MSGRANRRWGQERDKVEPEIILALETAGFQVEKQTTMDLLVGGVPKFGPKAGLPSNFRLECKTPAEPTKSGRVRKGERAVHRGWSTDEQREYYEKWPGQKAIVWTIDMALLAVGAKRE